MIHKPFLKYLVIAISVANIASAMLTNLDMHLIKATKNGDISQVKVLLKYKLVNVNCVDIENIYDHTPLNYACRDGHLEIAELLVENNANINYMSPKGLYPLCWASTNDHIPIVKLLLSKGAQIYQNAYRDPLLIVSFKGYFDIAKILLEYGANPNISDATHGTTPLMVGNREIVQLLLDYNADTSIKSKLDLTARDYAFQSGYGPIVAAIDLAENKRAIHNIFSQRIAKFFSTQPIIQSLLACKREVPD